jgi:hypothetical protein
MRELKRSIAKANMRVMGIRHLFKHTHGRGTSFFARNWREHVTPIKAARRRAKA